MRIVPFIEALIAVIGFVVLHPSECHIYYNSTKNESSRRTRYLRRGFFNDESWQLDSFYKQSIPLISPGKLLTAKENLHLLKQEAKNRSIIDCCPSVLEMIEPEGGKNQDDQFVELYRDGNYRQRFYELSCHNDIKDKPCRFMDKKIHDNSRCVQKYSYTYALVKNTDRHHQKISNKNFPSFPAVGPEGVTWTLDYIRVRSGCSCVVLPPVNKRKRPKHKRIRHEDET